MNFKFIITLTIVQSIVYIVAQPTIVANNYDGFEFDCNFILSSMNFLYSRCVQFIFGYDLYSVECIKTIMENSENVTFYIRSLHWLLNRNTYKEESLSNLMSKKSTKSCENFLFVLKDVVSLQAVLHAVTNNASVLTLFPYTKLYFLFVDHTFQFVPSRMVTEISKFLYENAQFGYAYELNAVTKEMTLRDFLLPDIESNRKIRSNLIHPIVNRENNEKQFRLSFYNCSPFVVYVDEENLRFHGIEYNLVREVTKNWNIQHILRDESNTGISPWITMFTDLENHTADLAMCSIWISDFDNTYDASSFYSHECNTLMIPKPKRLSEITAIYTTFSGQVWLTFGLLCLATAIILWGSAIIGIVNKSVYASIARAFLEIINIATQHGVEIFPRQQSSIKMLLMSWILACSLIGVYYVTIYTSRLSAPGYTELIDTIEEFIENDMMWGSYYIYPDIKSGLNASSNPAHNELNRRIVVFKNHDDAKNGLATGKFGVNAGIANGKYFVTYDWNEQLNLLSSFRVLKRECIFNYYTVFALQKFSPYTELFSDFALRFQEYGITQFWFSTVYRDKAWLSQFFEDYPQENKEHTALHFSSIKGALFLLFVSHIFSSVVFIGELTAKRLTRRSQQWIY